jgi:hypothetical protein
MHTLCKEMSRVHILVSVEVQTWVTKIRCTVKRFACKHNLFALVI